MDSILQRADEFAAIGITHFKVWELYSWFNAERVSKNVWRTLDQYLSDRAPDATIKLIETGHEVTFIDASRMTDLGDKK